MPTDSSEVKKSDSRAMNGPMNRGDQKKPNEYETLLKKGGSLEKGVFNVRHIEKKWYFEISDEVLDRMFLVVTRYVSVPQNFDKFPGEEIADHAIYFEKYDDKTLFLRSYNKSKIAPDGNDIAMVLDRSTNNPIIAKFDVIGKDSVTGARLIDVTNLFMQDNSICGLRGVQGVGAQQMDRTFIDTIKTFPINIEVSTLRTYMEGTRQARPGATPTAAPAAAPTPGNFMTFTINTSIVLLPEKPMQPRLQDERVGYFTRNITKFSDSAPSERTAIISRYRLEPKDPQAYKAGKLVEPKKQIVYYIDPATPKKWVPYLMQGINDWKEAFEAAGFKNAIVAKECPADGSVSPDDARFCFLRYLPSETENAYGPHIIDPRSGEIIESHICWFHNVMNLLKKWYTIQCGPLDKRLKDGKIDDKLMGQLIRFVSSHEVGHTLGLRHNMGASFATPVEKLRDKAWVEKNGHTASIMDYARFNYVAQPEDGISEKGLFPRINDYDKWAIKWGYQYRPEFSDPFKEKDQLRKEVTQVLSNNPRLWYSGGEGRGSDPRSQTEDLSDNNMKASDYGMKNLKRVMEKINVFAPVVEGQYKDLTDFHTTVRQQYQRYVGHVTRNIAGRFENSLPTQNPYGYVPKARQKEAIDWVGRNIFDTPMWLYPEEISIKTGFDAESEIISRQNSALSQELSTSTLSNIFKQGVYPLNEYLDDVFATVWKPLDNKDEKQNQHRR
ncbi:MAG: zinc-dependent metalloprotease, partial [Prevotella sp.]|nr:zinc-dependent metalloprotease [Prevotella sp.]